jgi:hypothetical protein
MSAKLDVEGKTLPRSQVVVPPFLERGEILYTRKMHIGNPAFVCENPVDGQECWKKIGGWNFRFQWNLRFGVWRNVEISMSFLDQTFPDKRRPIRRDNWLHRGWGLH